MAEGQGQLDPSPIRLLVRQSADAQLATHAGERGDQLRLTCKLTQLPSVLRLHRDNDDTFS